MLSNIETVHLFITAVTSDLYFSYGYRAEIQEDIQILSL